MSRVNKLRRTLSQKRKIVNEIEIKCREDVSNGQLSTDILSNKIEDLTMDLKREIEEILIELKEIDT